MQVDPCSVRKMRLFGETDEIPMGGQILVDRTCLLDRTPGLEQPPPTLKFWVSQSHIHGTGGGCPANKRFVYGKPFFYAQKL